MRRWQSACKVWIKRINKSWTKVAFLIAIIAWKFCWPIMKSVLYALTVIHFGRCMEQLLIIVHIARHIGLHVIGHSCSNSSMTFEISFYLSHFVIIVTPLWRLSLVIQAFSLIKALIIRSSRVVIKHSWTKARWFIIGVVKTLITLFLRAIGLKCLHLLLAGIHKYKKFNF